MEWPVQIIIHAGNTKTGSSSLQQYLYANSAKMKEIGVIYPDFGHRAHWLLSAAFGRNGENSRTARRIARGRAPMTIEAFEAEVEKLLVEFDDKLLILSNEGLGHEPRAGMLVDFIKEKRPDAEIIVLDYIRSPLSHFPSGTQQNLKAEGDRSLFPAHWISTHCIRATYLRRVMREHLVLRVFSPKTLVNGDVIDDFIDFVKRHTGLTLPENTDKAPRNASFSAPACGVLALRDLVTDPPFPAQYRKPFLLQLRAADEALGPEKLKLPEDFRDAILANNYESWNELIDETEYDEATRESLKLPAAGMPAGIESTHSGMWVARSITKNFIMEYLRAISRDLRAGDARQLSEWVVHAVNSTTPLHNVTIEREDVATLANGSEGRETLTKSTRVEEKQKKKELKKEEKKKIRKEKRKERKAESAITAPWG